MTRDNKIVAGVLVRATYHEVVLTGLECTNITPHQLCEQAGLSDHAIKVNHMSRSTFLKLEKALVQLTKAGADND